MQIVFMKCILGNFCQSVTRLVNQLRVFFGVVHFKATHPAPTSSTHRLVQARGRGCLVSSMDGPSGSSGFADDTALHTGGCDAVPAMRALLISIGPLLKLLGMSINMSKSYISAINFATRRAIPNTTFGGTLFSVLLTDQPHKHLGIRNSV